MAEIGSDAVSAAEGAGRKYEDMRAGVLRAAESGYLPEVATELQLGVLIDIAESLSALVAVERRRFGQCL